MLQEKFAREMQEKQNALLQEQERMKAEKEELRKKQQRLFQLASSFSTSWNIEQPRPRFFYSDCIDNMRPK